MRSFFSRGRLIVAAAALAITAVPGLAAADVMRPGLDAVSATEAASCTPGYTPCIPNKASDVDCAGGSGNGPRYTKAGVVYRVTGSDRYRLDADNDGKGCER